MLFTLIMKLMHTLADDDITLAELGRRETSCGSSCSMNCAISVLSCTHRQLSVMAASRTTYKNSGWKELVWQRNKNNTHAYIVHNGIKLKPIFGLQQYSCIYSIHVHVICFSCKNSNLGPKIFQRFPHRSFKRTKEHDEWCTINNWNLCKSSKFFEGSHSIIPVILRVGKCVLYTGNGLFHICHCQYLVVDKVKDKIISRMEMTNKTAIDWLGVYYVLYMYLSTGK